MGTDIYPILTVRQLENREVEPENVLDIVDAIETEFGRSFEDQENETYTAEGIRWSNMVEDMTEFSKKHPGILFGIRYEWPDDGSEYMEWFENGRYYCDARPEWEPIFQEAKFLKDTNPQAEPVAAEPTTGDPYTVVVEHKEPDENMFTVMTVGTFGPDANTAAAEAIDELIKRRGLTPPEEDMDMWRSQYKCIAIYAGRHTNLVQ